MSRCVVILGMHRSGTSCLTRVLHHAGLDLGNRLLKNAVPDNLLGHWEDRTAIRINDQILTTSHGAWDRVPEKLTIDASTTREMIAFVDQWNSVPIWGWKDPRKTLTFSAWQPHLPATVIVACIRHPYAVARSLAVREGWPLKRGLDLWLAYNRRLLEIVESTPGVFWYQHGAVPAHTSQQIEAICCASGLTFSSDLLELINPRLDHNGTEAEITEPELQKVHARLVALANQQLIDAEQCRNDISSETINQAQQMERSRVANQPGLEELAQELHRLSEVVSASDVVIQRAMWMNRQLENACLGLQNESAIGARALGDHIAETRKQAELTQRKIAELQGGSDSVPFATPTLRETIASLQQQQLQLAQSLNECRASLDAFRSLLPFRIYRKLAGSAKTLWHAIRPRTSLAVASSREDISSNDINLPVAPPSNRRVA